jgi:hypothetical protein
MLRGPMDWLPSRAIAVAVLGFVLSLVSALGSAFYLEPAPASPDEVAAAERLIELAMRESKSLGDGITTETGATLTSRDEGSRP